MPFCKFLYRLLAVSFLSLSCSAYAAAKPLVKSPLDDRQYEFIVLNNGLKVLLVSDPSIDKAAAALDVWIGSGEDPRERPGLAHFLEHMLFLGTEKYPQAGEYQTFISKNGGRHNAYTSLEHTNYFFDIDPNRLEPALDRFAQFFIAPLFNPKYVDREMHAVHSEFRAKYRDEYRRIADVYRDIYHPNVPLNKFSTGNIDTLANRGDDKIRDDLLDFYRRYYSSDWMALSVIGQQSLAELKAMVESRFSQVPRHKINLPKGSRKLFPDHFLPAQINIKPDKEIRRVSWVFPVPSALKHYRKKPLQYLGNLIGHEGEGSLLSLFKTQGWAESLSAGQGVGWREGTTFKVSVMLTEKGLEHIDLMESLLFSYINTIRSHGIEAWRFEEQADLGSLAFRFREKGRPIHEVSMLANDLHYVAPEDVLRHTSLFATFDRRLIRTYLKKLTPDNVLRVLVAPGIATDKVSRWYQTPYKVISKKTPPVLDDKYFASLEQELVLPIKNPFIPQDLSVKFEQNIEAKIQNPQLLTTEKDFKVWYASDNHFNVPRGQVRIRLLSPATASSDKGAAATRIFAKLLDDKLNELAYPALLAGLHFRVTPSSRGIDIRVNGFSDRLRVLLTEVINSVNTIVYPKTDVPGYNLSRFETLKTELARQLRNSELKTPYRQLLADLPVALYHPYWSDDVLFRTIEGLTVKEFNHFLSQLLPGASVEMLVYGNFTQEEAQQLANSVKTVLDVDIAGPSMPVGQVTQLHGDGKSAWKNFKVDHSDQAVAYYLQGTDDDVKTRAAILLIQQVLAAPFYEMLRTEKQLGYVVFAASYPIRQVPGVVAVVQSPTASLKQLMAEVDGFLITFKDRITNDFDMHKQALLTKLKEKPKNQNEQANEFWDAILEDDSDFKELVRLQAAVEKITPQQLSRHYERLIQNRDNRLLLVSGKDDPASVKESQVIKDYQEFKKNQPYYVYP